MFFMMLFALIAAVSIVATPASQIILFKAAQYVAGIKFMVLAKDLPSLHRGTNYIRMDCPVASPSGQRTIRVVFVRHGQSQWNSLFNTFGLQWPLRVVKAMIRELGYFFTSPFESDIIDSPLSTKGVREARELAAFVQSSRHLLPFNTSQSVIVSSNLRRAMETALVGLGPRLSVTGERIVVDSSLQEGSRNIDAQSFSSESGKLAPLPMGNIADPNLLHTAFTPYLNMGNKVIGEDVYCRMDQFLKHLFGGTVDGCLLPETGPTRRNQDLKEVIVVGHSGYFRNFFRRFLPISSKHVAKVKKMQNCAVVAFDLVRNETNNGIFVSEASIQVLYKGFQ